jgi:aspartate kinase
MARLVQKFGGTSLSSVQRIKNAARIAVDAASRGHELAVVVSAMGKTTDRLLAMADKVSAAPNARELDMLLATGEQQSIALMSMAIGDLGWQARSFTGAQAGIITENLHGSARIKHIDTAAIESTINRNEIAVVAGFQGISSNQEVTTLGRGGSDTTAVALAAALDAERCDIYKDVDGVFTADPHLVSDAQRLSCLSYEEMLELASAGARVLHARSVEVAMESHVPIRVRSSFKPEELGTLITHKFVAPDYTICSIVLDANVACFSLRLPNKNDEMKALGSISSLFTRLGEIGIDTEMVMLLAREDEPFQELNFTIAKIFREKVLSIIESHKSALGDAIVFVDNSLARVSLVGRELNSKPEIIAKVFETLQQARIPVQMVSTGDLSMSVLLPCHHGTEAISLLHNRFGLGEQHALLFG